MADEWRSTTLGDHVDLLTGFPFESKSYSNAPLDVRLLRGDNVVQGTLRWDGAKHWRKARLNGYENYKLRAGDVVIAMDPPWIEAGLKYAAVRPSDIPSLLVQRVASPTHKCVANQIFSVQTSPIG